jgi:DNA-binding MarR family transcriptional regulator
MADFDVEDTLGYLVSKANQFTRNYFTHLLKTNNLNITVEQWAILNIVHAQPGVSQSDIARMTQTDKANVMRMIDLLEEKRFIHRVAAEHDRRAHQIQLTPQGQKMLDMVIPIAEEVNRVSAAGISPKEYESLKKMLRQIRTNTELAD